MKIYFKGTSKFSLSVPINLSYYSKQTCKCISIINFGNKDHSKDTMNVVCNLQSMPGFLYVSKVAEASFSKIQFKTFIFRSTRIHIHGKYGGS